MNAMILGGLLAFLTTTTNPDAPEPPPDEMLDIDLLDLEVPMVVTATRRAQRLDLVPQAMSVITAEDIRRSGARHVPDALRLVPGVDVADLAYGVSAVSPRGFHAFLARQVLVLVDGRQIFDSHFGGTLWGSWPFVLEDIERIEVIRGPGGVIWGPNAVNGVINIITRDPADAPRLTLKGGGGSHGSHREYLGMTSVDDGSRWRMSLEYEGSDGFDQGHTLLRGVEDDYRAMRANFYGVFDLDERTRFNFGAGHATMVDGLPPDTLSGFFLHHRSLSHATYVQGLWSRMLASDSTVQITAYVNDFVGSPGLSSAEYRYDQLALQFSHSFRPHARHHLIWGFDGRIDLIDGTRADPFLFTRDRVETGTLGFYVQDEWELAERWMLHLGGRVDYEFYGGAEPSARAALSYDVSENLKAYAAVSRAVQIAPAGLRFMDLPLLDGIVRARGHRSIEPEVLWAYELGCRGQFNHVVDYGVNLFWHEFDDVTTISPALDRAALLGLDLNNRAAASMFGVELDVRYRVTPSLQLLGHYTYQNLDWRANVPLHDKDTISPPHHKFMIGAQVEPIDGLMLSSHLYYVDAVEAPSATNPFVARRIDPYFRLDLLAEYSFMEDRAAVRCGVRNLLDPDHHEGGSKFLADVETPRMVFAELRWSFD